MARITANKATKLSGFGCRNKCVVSLRRNTVSDDVIRETVETTKNLYRFYADRLSLAQMSFFNQPICAISSLFKLLEILAPLLLSPPLLWKSLIALFEPHFWNQLLHHIVNQTHLFMHISTHFSLLHFLHLPLLHSFTLNSKLIFSVNLSTIDLSL